MDASKEKELKQEVVDAALAWYSDDSDENEYELCIACEELNSFQKANQNKG